MGKFEREELAERDVALPVTLEENESDDSNDVGEDKVGSEVNGRAVVNLAEPRGRSAERKRVGEERGVVAVRGR